MKINHLAFVIQPDGTELELAEPREFNNPLEVSAVGTPRGVFTP